MRADNPDTEGNGDLRILQGLDVEAGRPQVVEGLKLRGVKLHLLDLGGDIASTLVS